ncbi:programmed cell death protein 2-like [Teleopsis dalmanni]|uniref:programmed cell death protein 2-like n=1 Tax=Teleopsis dalmanni TaxID=139649 RepID=UPI0018CF1501|nr:programmed cell death protein 2-like [Teleopsis dalmanni]
MAKNKSTVFLGYEDEEISAKHATQLNSTVNKIGGTPDWPFNDIKVPPCPICSSARPLLVQLYAPLEHSQFHRTLYIFACLNPICSQNSKSWLCIRTQHLETPNPADIISVVPPPPGSKKKKNKQSIAALPMPHKVNWCSGADDWGENTIDVEEMDTEADDVQFQNEENGNVIAKNDNSPVRPLQSKIPGASLVGSEEEDDDEDESTSMENDLICGFGQLDMHAAQHGAEDPNANCAGGIALDGLLVGPGASATICAEIEGAETDVVLVETPKKPERDLIALFKHTPQSAALGPLAKITDVTIKPYFISVDIEVGQGQNEYDYVGSLSADHVLELYQDYKRQDETKHSPSGGAVGATNISDTIGIVNGGGGDEGEVYEKTLPAHGDIIFHQFVSTLQRYPGQVLRYSRDTYPLLIAPLAEAFPKCPNCNGDTICEVQILSTLIPKLRLNQNNEPAPIEYGNVLVLTCLKSCWDTPDKMRYERVIIQVEK